MAGGPEDSPALLTASNISAARLPPRRVEPSRHRPGARPANVGRSTAFVRMMAWVRRVAPTDLPVLIRGETGAGKEGVARALHDGSRRHDGPFLAVNCAAFTETLLDAELFGAVRGAYTGADRDRPGLFRMARGGTLFLDEVGDMPLSMQARLLRVLEERCVRPVGGERTLPVDVRVLAATHRDLTRELTERLFRADLYHRLAVAVVTVPPLRSRSSDLPLLVDALAPRLRAETGFGPPRLAACASRALLAHDWPGNVRELHAVLACALLRAGDAPIEARHLQLPLRAEPLVANGEPLERTMIDTALRATEGNVAGAARRIGWTRQKLYRRMKLFGFK